MAQKKGAVDIFRISRKSFLKGKKRKAQLYKNINRIIYSCDISYEAEIGTDLELPHQGLGVVIGPKVKIGNRCRIYQNVTLGYKQSNNNPAGVPIIEDNVLICANAVIVGEVHVGENAIIGSNALVINDVPENAVVGGVPAKIIKYRKLDEV